MGLFRKAGYVLFAISLAALPIAAQTSRGTVTGLVTDSQRAAVPGANVTLTALATNAVRTTSPNESGLYRFDAVDPGAYSLTVKNTGFSTFSVREFHVAATQLVTLDVILEIGEVQQVLEVTGESAQLQVEAPVRGKNVLSTDIQNLPFQSRNPVSLALTTPGIVSSRFATPSNSFVVNGSRGRSNNFMIDGTDNNDISVAGQAFTVGNPDAIQEVSVQTTNFDAEFGRAGGAVVNVITKSGSNLFHGSAGFVLDSTWDDAISSSLAQSPAIRARGHNLPGTEQQFDGTFGGRIIRDRTFFFGSFLELRQFSQSTTEMVSPTTAGRATLLSLFPQGRNANADLLQAITAGFDGNARKFNIPLGNNRPDVEFGRIVIPYSQRLRDRQWSIKGDHRIASNDNMSARLFVDDQVQPAGGETLSFPSFVTSSISKTNNAGLTETHVFSPTMTNELRLAFLRFILESPLDPVNPLGKTSSLIAISGINTTAQSVYGIRSVFPQGRTFNNYVLQDTISKVHGTHSFRAGFELVRQRARQAAPFDSRGTLSYGSSASGSQTFSGLANFLDDFGGAGSATRAFGTAFYYPSLFRQSYFAQDRWRATSSLTVTLGLRYEYFGTPMNVIRTPAYAGIFNVNPVTFESPFTLPNKVNPDKNNFSPMIGIAYAPSADEGILGWLIGHKKTSIRTGYGIGYDSFFNNITSNAVAAAPNAVSAATTSQAITATPRGEAGLSRLIPQVAPAITPLLSQSGIDPNLRNPYYQRWSFGVQRELPAALLLDVSYVGSKGTRLFAQEDLNPLVPASLQAPVPASVPANRRMPRLDPLSGSRGIRTNGGSSIYHSGQFEAKRRFANGFSFSAAYTYSKVIDNVSEIFSYGNTANNAIQGVPSIFGGLTIDRAVGFFDRTHRAVFTYNYELPFFKQQRSVLGRVAGGWSVTGLTTYESGVPYSVVNGQDADGLGGATGDRPDFNPLGQKGVRAVPNSSSPTGYVNPDAGQAPIDPRTARYIGLPANNGLVRTRSGNLGRNTERGPGLRDWDLNVNKEIPLTERFHLQFRAEFYNVFNTPQYGRVSVSPFAPPQNAQTIAASVFNSQPGLFLNETAVDGGGRVIRWQLRLRF